MMASTCERRFADSDAMRERFTAVITDLVAEDPRIAAVFADFSWDRLSETAREHPRFFNVGAREQLLIDVAGGLALAGLRPVAHTSAGSLAERPFGRIRIGLNLQDVGAVLVSAGASFDLDADGRALSSPADVALMATLPGWRISVPGHADEAEIMLREASRGLDLEYIRLSTQTNSRPYWTGEDGFVALRLGANGTVVAVGPIADTVLAAVGDLDVTVLYAPRIRPFDRETLLATLSAPDVVLVEPYLTGTSAAEVSQTLADVPHRLLCLGVAAREVRRYGTPEEHAAAYGLDVTGLRSRITAFIGG